jgi:hypothetical protein
MPQVIIGKKGIDLDICPHNFDLFAYSIRKPQKNCLRQKIMISQSKQYARLLNKLACEVNYPESNMKLFKT